MLWREGPVTQRCGNEEDCKWCLQVQCVVELRKKAVLHRYLRILFAYPHTTQDGTENYQTIVQTISPVLYTVTSLVLSRLFPLTITSNL